MLDAIIEAYVEHDGAKMLIAGDSAGTGPQFDARAHRPHEGDHASHAVGPQEHGGVELHALADRWAAAHETFGADTAVQAPQVEGALRGAEGVGKGAREAEGVAGRVVAGERARHIHVAVLRTDVRGQ